MSRQIAVPGRNLPMQRPPMSAAGMGGSDFSIKDILGILRRRLWLIVIISLLAIMISVGLFVLCKVKYPKYTSVGYIRCRMPSDIGPKLTAITPRRDVLEFIAASNAAIMNSENFTSELLGRTSVKQTKWFTNRSEDPTQRQLDLQKSFGASAMRESPLIKVRMQASNKDDAKIIVNEAMTQFVNDVSNTQTSTFTSNLASYNKQLQDFEAQKKRLQQDLQNLTVSDDGWQEGRLQLVYQELNILRQEILALNAEIRRLNVEKERMQSEMRSFGVSSEVSSAVEMDPEVSGLRTQLENLTQREQMLLSTLGEGHRQVKDVQSLVQTVQQSLESRESMLRQQYTQRMLQNIEQQIQRYTQEYNAINERYLSLFNEHQALEGKGLMFQQISDEVERIDKRMEEVNSLIYSVQMELKDPERITVEVAQRASDPLSISFPRLPIFLAGGVFLGLAFSVGLAFLLEFMDDSIKTPLDITRQLNVPMIGMIPEYKEDDIDVARISHLKPQELISEFYRQVRTNLFFSAPAGELKTMLITSSSAGCGKTTTAVNLAITIAHEGRRVLLIDGNFRRPMINRLFPYEGDCRGLSNVLIGQASSSDVIHPSGIENIDIIDCGPLPPNPSDLLSSRRMHDLLESQKQHYDYILIDGPPTLVMADARILAGLTDGTVLVVKSNQTPKGAVQRVINELKVGNIRILGVLLNCVRPRKGGYFNKVYQSYYDYINVEPSVAGKLPYTPASKE